MEYSPQLRILQGPGKPVAYNDGLLSLNYEAMLKAFFGRLLFQGPISKLDLVKSPKKELHWKVRVGNLSAQDAPASRSSRRGQMELEEAFWKYCSRGRYPDPWADPKKVDPPQGSVIYPITELESRVGGFYSLNPHRALQW